MKTIKLGYVHMFTYSPSQALAPHDGKVRQLDPMEVVLPSNRTFTLEIDYPLETAYTQTIRTGVRGMTRRVLVNKIVKAYEHVYANEDKYGVWGHHMTDLFLHTVNVTNDGKALLVDCDS